MPLSLPLSKWSGYARPAGGTASTCERYIHNAGACSSRRLSAGIWRWKRSGDVHSFTTTLPAVDRNIYLRVRGTNTEDLEPLMDAQGEDPWADLWFYSNPIFVETNARTTLLEKIRERIK